MIRIGVIGYGYWGPNLVRNFSALPEVRVHAIADRDGKRLALAKSIYPSVAVTTDIGTLFSNPDIDAVAIATPVSSHYDLALRALRAGKHVFVEKPIAETVEQAEHLIAEAERRKLVLHVDGFRPAGLIRLSTTVVDDAPVLTDYGSTFGSGTATHHLMLHRQPSGALVFGAGPVQWSWGLDPVHDNGSEPADPRMQQATINLLADMGVQPATLQAGLVAAEPSADEVAPISTVAAPAAGSALAAGVPVIVSGTAADSGGGVVGGVEVSLDGGETWRPTVGREAWSYVWTPTVTGAATILSRAVDDSANLEVPGSGVEVTVD